MKQYVDLVLLIDDDRITNFYNTRIIEKHASYRDVTAVKGGEAALAYLEECHRNALPKPNLIFLDLNMPGMNGWEFLDAFENMDPSITHGIKVILLSTSSDPEEVKRSMIFYHVNDYINKPLSEQMLDEVVDKHFRPTLAE